MLDIIITFAKHIVAALTAGIPGFVTRLLSATGLVLVNLNAVIPALKDFLSQYLGQLPPAALTLIGALGLDIAISMIVSAYAVKLAFKWLILPRAVAENIPGVNL